MVLLELGITVRLGGRVLLTLHLDLTINFISLPADAQQVFERYLTIDLLPVANLHWQTETIDV